MSTREDAKSIAQDVRDRIESGEIETREGLLEAVHETVDYCGRVIYTSKAREAVCEYGTDAYTDRFGEEGLVKDGTINWSVLAFCIVEDLVYEHLSALGIDPNSPFPCETCEGTHDTISEAQECCSEEDEE